MDSFVLMYLLSDIGTDALRCHARFAPIRLRTWAATGTGDRRRFLIDDLGNRARRSIKRADLRQPDAEMDLHAPGKHGDGGMVEAANGRNSG